MRFLADDSLEGRRTGTEGFALAAEYVAGQFEAIGLEPAGEEGFFQNVTLRRGVLDRDVSALTLSRDGHPLETVMLGDYPVPHRGVDGHGIGRLRRVRDHGPGVRP